MNTAFDFKQGRSPKAFILALSSTVVLLAASTATLLVVTLSGNASANTGIAYTGTAPSYVQTVAANHGVDRAALVLFESTNLKGALK